MAAKKKVTKKPTRLKDLKLPSMPAQQRETFERLMGVVDEMREEQRAFQQLMVGFASRIAAALEVQSSQQLTGLDTAIEGLNVSKQMGAWTKAMYLATAVRDGMTIDDDGNDAILRDMTEEELVKDIFERQDEILALKRKWEADKADQWRREKAASERGEE